jgi:lipopolysaccharide assembly LptE-like protein
LPRISGLLLLALNAALGGCLYGFGGGKVFPPEIRTVAIMPFDNLTTEPALSVEVDQAVKEAIARRLGLRLAAEKVADAIVTGSIVRYEPDIPVAYSSGSGQDVDVTRRQVQLVVKVDIVRRETGEALLARDNFQVTGTYSKSELDGRKDAIDKLVIAIVDEAQSQW